MLQNFIFYIVQVYDIMPKTTKSNDHVIILINNINRIKN